MFDFKEKYKPYHRYFKTLNRLENNSHHRKKRIYYLLLIFLLGIGFLFVPWTQNIVTEGYLTTLRPEHRPQSLQSIIPGRITKWYVKEGDFVFKGDTILYITEVKDEYFDPNYIDRTYEQIKAKEASTLGYESKIGALDNQINAIKQVFESKLSQTKIKYENAKLKVQSDSADFLAAKAALDISKDRLNRMEDLYKKGLKPLTELESRRIKVQEDLAKLTSASNKLNISIGELKNAKTEMEVVVSEYTEKVSKTESDKFTTISNLYDAQNEVVKLENKLASFKVRRDAYYVVSPQDGYVTKVLKFGIGETLKEGTEIATIAPSEFTIAAEIYVNPVDYPLVRKGDKLRVQFDGWPALVFSGWPGANLGTYGAQVLAIDNVISDNGKFRVLIVQNSKETKWPESLRIGGGTKAYILLNDVPLWYEIWRKVNGFPPDFYKDRHKKIKDNKLKD
jgi:adhesin transport system membrane fusion protein